MRWKPAGKWCLTSEPHGWTITKSLVNGQPIYQLFHGKQAKAIGTLAECKAAAK